MRRKDKEIKDMEEIESIINKSNVCRIALSENDSPYIVPVCFGYKDNCLYFHSANEGKKIEIIENGFGKVYIIDDFDEKIKAMNIIIEHYSNGLYEFQKKIIDTVTIIKVVIENITGKRSGY